MQARCGRLAMAEVFPARYLSSEYSPELFATFLADCEVPLMPVDAPKLANPLSAGTSAKAARGSFPAVEIKIESHERTDRERTADRVASAVVELCNLQQLLLAEDVDPRLLTDFRDALNRTRNTAWAVQQSLACQGAEADSATLMHVLAVERIRVAYQLGSTLAEDLRKPDIKLQPGQLLELYRVMKDLTGRLAELVG